MPIDSSKISVKRVVQRKAFQFLRIVLSFLCSTSRCRPRCKLLLTSMFLPKTEFVSGRQDGFSFSFPWNAPGKVQATRKGRKPLHM